MCNIIDLCKTPAFYSYQYKQILPPHKKKKYLLALPFFMKAVYYRLIIKLHQTFIPRGYILAHIIVP